MLDSWHAVGHGMPSVYTILTSTTLESNMSLLAKHTIAKLQNNEEVRRQYLALSTKMTRCCLMLYPQCR
jgi:hypothetical protein